MIRTTLNRARGTRPGVQPHDPAMAGRTAVTISIAYPVDELAALDAWCASARITRSAAVRAAVRQVYNVPVAAPAVDPRQLVIPGTIETPTGNVAPLATWRVRTGRTSNSVTEAGGRSNRDAVRRGAPARRTRTAAIRPRR